MSRGNAKWKARDAIAMLDRHELEAARAKLEDIVGEPVERKHHPPVLHATQPANEAKTPGTATPKPEGRIVDEGVLIAFREEFPRCALAGTPAGHECWYHPDSGGRAEAHHIKHRGQGGGDVRDNLAPLCAAHHTGHVGWHAPHWSPKRWCARYFGFLAPIWQQHIATHFPAGVPERFRALNGPAPTDGAAEAEQAPAEEES